MDLDTLVGSVRRQPMNLGGYDLIAPPDEQQFPTDEELQTEWRRRQAEEGRLLRQSESFKAVADNPVDRLFSVGQDAWADVLKQARTESLGTELQRVPAIVREPMLGVAASGSQVFGTALQPFSKRASEAVAGYGEMTSQAAEEAAKNDWFPKAGRIGRGAVSSLASAGVLSPLRSVGMAAGFGTMEYTDALREAEEAGLTESDQDKYARDRGLIEGGVSLAFTGASKLFKLPWLSGLEARAFAQEVAKRTLKDHGLTFLKTTLGELPEEVFTEIGHNLARKRIDPRAADWDKQIQTASDTVAQTLVTMGLAEGASLAGRAISKGQQQAPGEQLAIPPVTITADDKLDVVTADPADWVASNPKRAQALASIYAERAAEDKQVTKGDWTAIGYPRAKMRGSPEEKQQFAAAVASHLAASNEAVLPAPADSLPPGSSPESELKASSTGKVATPTAQTPVSQGDLVQWSPNGVDQFDSPRRVDSVQTTADGKQFAFVEGSNTGMPVDELVKVTPTKERQVIPNVSEQERLLEAERQRQATDEAERLLSAQGASVAAPVAQVATPVETATEPARTPAAAGEHDASTQTAAGFHIGDGVQWKINGTDQFPEPRKIVGFSADGQFAFVESSETERTDTGHPFQAIPVSQAVRKTHLLGNVNAQQVPSTAKTDASSGAQSGVREESGNPPVSRAGVQSGGSGESPAEGVRGETQQAKEVAKAVGKPTVVTPEPTVKADRDAPPEVAAVTAGKAEAVAETKTENPLDALSDAAIEAIAAGTAAPTAKPKRKRTVKEKKKDARAEANSEGKKLLKMVDEQLKSGFSSTAGAIFTPEIMSQAARYVRAELRAGVLTFADLVNDAVKAIGDVAAVRRLGPALTRAWDNIRAIPGMEARLDAAGNVDDILDASTAKEAPSHQGEAQPETPRPESPTPPEKPKGIKEKKKKSRGTFPLTEQQKDFLNTNPTALAFREADKVRKEMGLAPVLRQLQRNFPEMWVEKLKELHDAPHKADALMAELSATKRRTQTDEALTMLYAMADAQNKYLAINERLDAAEKSGDLVQAGLLQGLADIARDHYEQVSQIAFDYGSDQGRAFRVRQMMVKQDFTYVGMLRQRRNANDGKLTDEQKADTEAAFKKIKALQTERDEAVKAAEQEEVKLRTQEKITAAKEQVAATREKATKTDKAKAEIAAKKAKIAERLKRIRKIPDLTFEITAAAGTLGYELTQLAKEFAELGVAHGKAFLAGVEDGLGKKFVKAHRAEIMQAWKDFRAANPPTVSGRFTAADLLHLRKSVDDMVYSLVESGVEDPKQVVQAVYDELKPYIDGLTLRQTQEIISGYGPYEPPTKTELDEQVSTIKSILLLMSKLDSITQDKQVPWVKGGKRRKPTAVERDLRKQIDELLKKEGLIADDPEKQQETLLSTAMTVLKNQLEQMQTDLDRGYAIVNRKRVPLSKPELDALRAARDEKRQEWLGLFTKEHLQGLIDDTTKKLESPKLSQEERDNLTRLLEEHQAAYDKRYKPRTMAERVADAKRDAESRMDAIREQIRVRKRLNDQVKPLQPDQELQRLLAEEKMLDDLLDKYLPEAENPYSTEQAVANRERQLEREIQQINSEIHSGRRKENKTSTNELDSDYIQSLVRMRDARIEVRDTLFPPPEPTSPTLEQRLERAERSIDRAIQKATTDRDKLIVANITGNIPAGREDVQGPKPTTAAIQAKEAELQKLRQQKKQLRQTINPDEAFMRRKQRQLQQVQANRAALAAGTYEPKTKLKRTLSKAAQEAEAALNAERVRWRHDMEKERDANRHPIDQTLDTVKQAVRFPKDWKTGWTDLGFFLIQGGPAFHGNPIQTFQSAVDSVNTLFAKNDPKAVDDVNRMIAADPDYKSGVLTKMGLRLNPDAEALSREEEAAQSWILRVPGVRILARRANNAQSAFLNLTRYKFSKTLLSMFVVRGGYAGDRQLEALGDIRDVMTGRGAMTESKRAALRDIFGWFAFAPQFAVAQLQSAFFYDVYAAWKSGGGLPMYRTVARLKVQQAAGLILMQTLLTALYNALGDDDETKKAKFVLDPWDKNFLATTVDNGTMNLTLNYGLRLLVSLLQQLPGIGGRRITDRNEEKSFLGMTYRTGKHVAPIDERKDALWEAISHWLRGRAGVFPNVALQMAHGKDFKGDPYTLLPDDPISPLKVPGGLLSEAYPISAKQTLDVANLEGPNVAQKTLTSVEGFLGAGISTRAGDRHLRYVEQRGRDYDALAQLEKIERLAGRNAFADEFKAEMLRRYKDHQMALAIADRNKERNDLRKKTGKTDGERSRLIELNTELAAEAKRYRETGELPEKQMAKVAVSAGSRMSTDPRGKKEDPVKAQNDFPIEASRKLMKETYPNPLDRAEAFLKSYDDTHGKPPREYVNNKGVRPQLNLKDPFADDPQEHYINARRQAVKDDLVRLGVTDWNKAFNEHYRKNRKANTITLEQQKSEKKAKADKTLAKDETAK